MVTEHITRLLWEGIFGGIALYFFYSVIERHDINLTKKHNQKRAWPLGMEI